MQMLTRIVAVSGRASTVSTVRAEQGHHTARSARLLYVPVWLRCWVKTERMSDQITEVWTLVADHSICRHRGGLHNSSINNCHLLLLFVQRCILKVISSYAPRWP